MHRRRSQVWHFFVGETCVIFVGETLAELLASRANKSTKGQFIDQGSPAFISDIVRYERFLLQYIPYRSGEVKLNSMKKFHMLAKKDLQKDIQGRPDVSGIHGANASKR